MIFMEVPHNALSKQFDKVEIGEVFVFYDKPYLKIKQVYTNQGTYNAVELRNNYLSSFFCYTLVHVCPTAYLSLT